MPVLQVVRINHLEKEFSIAPSLPSSLPPSFSPFLPFSFLAQFFSQKITVANLECLFRERH